MAYDPRAVKVSKSVKRVAARITDKNLARSLIKSYARAEAVNQRAKSSRKKDKE
jgi:hypothetical protein